MIVSGFEDDNNGVYSLLLLVDRENIFFFACYNALVQTYMGIINWLSNF